MFKSRFLSISAVLTTLLFLVSSTWRQAPSNSRLNLASTELDQTWVPTVMLPWVNYGGDFGGIPGWNRKGVSADENIDKWFTQLERAGVRSLAWFLLADGRGALVFDGSGYVRGLAPGFLNDYQNVLGLAKKHDLQVIWILADYEIGMPYQMVGGVREFGHPDLLEDAAKRRSFIDNGVNAILQASGKSEQIAGWIVVNEPEHLLRSGYVSEPAIRSFVQEVTAAIKQYDPSQRVGIANADLASMILFSDIDVLDFLVFHHYKAHIPPPVKSVRAYLRRSLGSAADTKPIFVGEFDWRSPPGGNLVRFLYICRDFGYSNAWPWSLLNDWRKPGGYVEPQFDEANQYARSVSSLRQAGEPQGSSDVRKLREWALSRLQSEVLNDVEQRVVSLRDEPATHKAQAEMNREWEHRAQLALDAARENLKTQVQNQQKAEADIEYNTSWAKGAAQSERAKAQSALEVSLNWLKDIQQQIISAQGEISKQQCDLATAEERTRMHSYLARETATELSWLETLREQLRDEQSLQSVIAGAVQ